MFIIFFFGDGVGTKIWLNLIQKWRVV